MSCATLLMASIGCAAPVEVSAWTIPTTSNGPSFAERVGDLLGSDYLTPRRAHGADERSRAARHVRHALAEDAGDADEHRVAGLDLC